jgi:lipopolysaccharide heptosyltransferase II
MNNDISRQRLKILIIRLSSIGDILLSTPFVRQIKLKVSDSEIDYVVKRQYADLLRFNPNINSLIEFDDRDSAHTLKKIRKEIRAKGYNYIFDLHNNWRSNYLRFGYPTGLRNRIKKDKVRQFLLVHFKKNIYEHIIPIPQRYLQVGENLGIADDQQGLDMFWDAGSESVLKTQLKHKHFEPDTESYICIAPGAGFYTKRWPVEYFKQLTVSLLHSQRYKLVILGGEGDRYLHTVFPASERVINLAAELNLLQSAIVLSRAKALIVNDTGLMHMAAAVKIPVLAIFGNTVEEFGFFPYRAKSVVIQNEKLNCRPCSHIGRNKCPKGHFKCMLELTPQIVLEQLYTLIEQERN